MRKRKHKYRLNRRTASKMIYSSMLELLFSAGIKQMATLKKIKTKVVKFLSPIRKGRNFVRNFNGATHSTCHSRAALSF